VELPSDSPKMSCLTGQYGPGSASAARGICGSGDVFVGEELYMVKENYTLKKVACLNS